LHHTFPLSTLRLEAVADDKIA